MIRKISKTNERRALERQAFFNALLDEVKMNGHDRLRAKASLAQSEAITDAVFALIGSGKRLLKSLFARPVRRPTTSTG